MSRRVIAKNLNEPRSVYYLYDDIRQLVYAREQCESLLDVYEAAGEMDRQIGAQKVLDLLGPALDNIIQSECVTLSEKMVMTGDWTITGRGPFYTLKIVLDVDK